MYNDKSSEVHNQIFTALKSCTEPPHITIQNENGKYLLQYKSGSIVRLSEKQLWYDKTDLVSILKLS